MIMNTDEQARIAGALKCVEVLRAAYKANEAAGSKMTTPEFFRQKDAAFAAILAAAGELSSQAAGVLGALADYALDGIQNTYSIGEQLDCEWLPDAAKTAQDVEAERAEFAAEMEV